MVKAGEAVGVGHGTAVRVYAATGGGDSIGLLAGSTNEENIYIGGKTEMGESKKGFPLAKGSFISVGIKDAGRLYMSGKAGDKLFYIFEGNIA